MPGPPGSHPLTCEHVTDQARLLCRAQRPHSLLHTAVAEHHLRHSGPLRSCEVASAGSTAFNWQRCQQQGCGLAAAAALRDRAERRQGGGGRCTWKLPGWTSTILLLPSCSSCCPAHAFGFCIAAALGAAQARPKTKFTPSDSAPLAARHGADGRPNLGVFYPEWVGSEDWQGVRQEPQPPAACGRQGSGTAQRRSPL
jgi:hypothetical protein